MLEFPQSLIPMPATVKAQPMQSPIFKELEEKVRSKKNDVAVASPQVEVDTKNATRSEDPPEESKNNNVSESIEVDISIEANNAETEASLNLTSEEKDDDGLPFDKNVTVEYLTGSYTLKELKNYLQKLGNSNVSGKKADMAQRILSQMNS